MAVAVSEEICLLSALHFWLFRQGEEEIKKTTEKTTKNFKLSFSLLPYRELLCCVYSTESVEEDGRDDEEEYYHEKQRH